AQSWVVQPPLKSGLPSHVVPFLGGTVEQPARRHIGASVFAPQLVLAAAYAVNAARDGQPSPAEAQRAQLQLLAALCEARPSTTTPEWHSVLAAAAREIADRYDRVYVTSAAATQAPPRREYSLPLGDAWI